MLRQVQRSEKRHVTTGLYRTLRSRRIHSPASSRRLMANIDITVVDERGFNQGAIIAAGQAFADSLAAQTSPTAVDTDKEIERLRSKGCEYREHEKTWRFLLRAY